MDCLWEEWIYQMLGIVLLFKDQIDEIMSLALSSEEWYDH